MALDELADLTMETVPRLREIAQSLRQTEQEGDVNRRVLYTSRIVQGMSLINHFMGSVLGTVDIDSRRSTPTPNTQTTRGDTQVLRTSAPTVASSEVNPEASTSSSGLKRKDEEEESEQPIKKAKQEDGKGKKKTD
ncbi:hypothetical protein G6F56_007929 [Rhizopus delemar]|nr:hypothetical protein G6F56_007929 [Rhizopus delemar]